MGGLFFDFERFSGEIATRCVTHRLTKKEIKKMTKEIKAKIKSGAELDDDTQRAIDALESVFADADLQFRFTMEGGQFQYVNNKVIGHSRTEFEDFDAPDERRHLVRLWLREQGDRSYPG